MEHNGEHDSPKSTNTHYQHHRLNSNLIVFTNYRYSRTKRRKRKDKVDEYIKSWENKISTINDKNIQPEKLP